MRKPFLLLVLVVTILFAFPTIPNNPIITPRQLLNSGPSGTTDYPWTTFHYDQYRDGATLASGPSSPTLMWSYTTGNVVYPSPVVSDGYVFIPSYDGTLYAFDEYTGALLWSFATGGNIYGTPTVYNGIVYVPSKNGFVYALNEQNGAIVWEIANDNLTPVTSSPVIANGTLFYGTFESPGAGKSEMVAVDAQTGTVIWKYDVSSYYIQAPPTVSHGRVFVGIGLNIPNPAVLIALNQTADPITGFPRQLWSYSPSGLSPPQSISTAPVAAYGNVYVSWDSANITALSQTTGKLVWSFNTLGGSNATTPAIYNGVMYVGTGAGIVYALNATNGKLIWRYPTATTIGPVTSSPALALGSNTLFVGSNDRYLYALNMVTGAFRWRYLTGGQVSSSPAVANNRVFFGSKDHKVYALGVTLPKLYDTMAAVPKVLEPGQNATLSIDIRNSTAPQSGATVVLTSLGGGTLSQPALVGPGIYQSNFTAAMVTSSTLVIIQLVANITGYLNAANQTSITVNPFPTLIVTVSAKPGSTTPGGEITLMIQVTNGTLLISGASLQLSSTAGGTFYSETDSGNGNYTATFSTPLQASSPVVTVRASKSEFTSGQGQTTVTVNGVPNLTTLKVSGIPVFYLAATGVVLFLLILAIVVRRKKTTYVYPSAKAAFNY